MNDDLQAFLTRNHYARGYFDGRNDEKVEWAKFRYEIFDFGNASGEVAATLGYIEGARRLWDMGQFASLESVFKRFLNELPKVKNKWINTARHIGVSRKDKEMQSALDQLTNIESVVKDAMGKLDGRNPFTENPAIEFAVYCQDILALAIQKFGKSK